MLFRDIPRQIHTIRGILIVAAICLLGENTAFSQGSVVYQTAGEWDKYIFMPDPSAPTVAKHGTRQIDFSGFQKVEGPGYYAELWWAPGEDRPEESLRPVPSSQVTFRSGSTAGLINGRSKLEIPGTFGGDRVTLQLRVWENFGHTVTSWEEALNNGSIHGKSNLFLSILAGADVLGNPILGSGSIRNGTQFFSLVVPEPSVFGLLWGALAARKIASRSR